MSENKGYFTRKREELVGKKSIAEYYDEGRFTSLGYSHLGWQHHEIDKVTETALRLLYEVPRMTSGGGWIEELAATCDFIADSYKALAKLIRARDKFKINQSKLR